MKQPSESLKDTQKWMQSSLIAPFRNNEEITNFYVAPSQSLSAAERLAIYQRSYYSRLLACMKEQFKALNYTLEDELFDEFSVMYLREKPSASPSLSDLGKGFPIFLERTRPDKDDPELWIDFMIAMAQFEVDLYTIFEQKGSEGELFATKETKDQNLVLNACFSLHNYPFDVNEYYQEVAVGNAPEISDSKEIYIAIYRTNYQVKITPLNKTQYFLLKEVQHSESIAKALKALTNTFNFDPNELSKYWLEWKEHWVNKGFFTIKNRN